MRIREKHSITDRIKLFFAILVLLILAWNLVNFAYKEKKSTKTSSVETLLETALQPVGSTMYIWGGGWDDTDCKSGESATRIGLSPQWEAFAKEQDETYDFKEYRFQREKGLDCSGYVGWVLYNTFEEEAGKPGYVTTSTDLAESLAKRGWGTLIKNPKNFLPGDIVSMEGHVWICLGTCDDGSVLLVHSSPPGVSVCGTKAPKEKDEAENDQEIKNSNKQNSTAVILAENYMTTYHANWQQKYPNRCVGTNYIENVVVFRWNESTMSDAKEMQKRSAEEVLERIIRKGEIP